MIASRQHFRGRLSPRARRVIAGPTLALVVGVVAALWWRSPDGNALFGFLQVLQGTAAIVTAVTGAWIALVYPATLTRLLGRVPDAKAESVTHLVEPLYYSAGVVAVSLVLPLARAIAHQYQVPGEAKFYLHEAFFGLLISLTWLQVWSILAMVSPGHELGAGLARLEADGRRDAALSRFGSPATDEEIKQLSHL